MVVKAASERLREVTIFRGLSGEEICAFLERAERKEVAPGTLIFRDGEEVSGLYLIESGQVVVHKALGDGTMHELARLDAMNIFGEMGLLIGGRARTASITASAPSVLWHVPRPAFAQMIEQGAPGIAKVLMNIARVLAYRLDAINKEMIKVVEGKGERRARILDLATFRDKLDKEWPV